MDGADLSGDGEPSGFLHCVWPARPEYLRPLRTAIRSWLAGLDVPEDDQKCLVLAADVALGNAVEHSYPSAPKMPARVELTLWAETEALYIKVADHGRWLAPTNHVPDHGRGIERIRQLAQCVVIQAGIHGTTVLLRHRLPTTPHVAPPSTEPSQSTS